MGSWHGPVDGFYERLDPIDMAGIYGDALSKLQRSVRTVIAHIDSGVAPHRALGYVGDVPPANLLIDAGLNTFDPQRSREPISDLTRSGRFLDDFIEFPDHGVKTLSVLLGVQGVGARGGMRGIVPGAKIVPYRTSNGPLFRNAEGPAMVGDAEPTRPLGRAIAHATASAQPIRVMSISMGNPAELGIFRFLLSAIGGRAGSDEETSRAVDAAYESGIIMVCSGGQIIDSVVYPAAYARTIAVGGYDRRGATFEHYPLSGYVQPQRVDVWAQAERINRASYAGEGTGAAQIFARDPGNIGDPSGTSYAAPQVAGAAALWVERHYETLGAKFGIRNWRVVESFRKVLRDPRNSVPIRTRPGDTRLRPALDVMRVLMTSPPDVSDADRRPLAITQGRF